MTSAPRSNNSRRANFSDEEDDRDRRSGRNSANSRSGGTRASTDRDRGDDREERNNRRNHDFEEEEYGSARKGVRTLRLDDREDDRDRDRERDRRSGMYRDPDRSEGRRGGDRRNDFEEEEDHTYNGARGGAKSREATGREARPNKSGRDAYDDRESNSRGGAWDGRNATGGSMDRDRYGREREEDSRYGKGGERGSALDDREVDVPRAIPNAPSVQIPPDLSNMRRFLTTPIPRQCGVIQCYIRRNKSGTNKLFPIYSLYLKEGDVFLMASKKRPKNKTSNYLISMGTCLSTS